MDWTRFDWLIDAALAEDEARRDATTLALVPEGLAVRAEVRARRDAVVCGLPLARRLAGRFDPLLAFEECVRDGSPLSAGQAAARLAGPAASVLAVERVMLNFVQHLSGVATLTARFVQAVRGTPARIYDTRKTTPGWRELEKYAVRCGGGCNHRMSLADRALIKDNHLALLDRAGPDAAADAVRRLRKARPGLTVMVEVQDLDQLEAALAEGPDVILLDNMTPQQVREAAHLARRVAGEGRPPLEASGGITLENVRQFAEAGADRISVGALTHSAPAADLALDVVG